jgi:hypothetical protein
MTLKIIAIFKFCARRNLLENNGRSNSSQAWGLIVLLLSKAAGHNKFVDDIELDKATGILHRYTHIIIIYFLFK